MEVGVRNLKHGLVAIGCRLLFADARGFNSQSRTGFRHQIEIAGQDAHKIIFDGEIETHLHPAIIEGLGKRRIEQHPKSDAARTPRDEQRQIQQSRVSVELVEV